MRIVYIVCFFILGTVMGSFYNVLGLRVVNKESIIKPKSHCDKCGHVLSWYELIPIFSFIFLKGRCRNCKTKLSYLYLFSEFFCGVLFAISFYSFGFTPNLIISLTLSSLLIIVTVCDITYMIIPDRFIVISGIIILLTKLVFFEMNVFLNAILNGIISFGLMYSIMKLGDYIFKKETLGGADIKLMFIVGICLDFFLPLLVIIIASMIALPISLVLLVKEKEHAIPFGPFILVGTMIVFLTKLDGEKIINFLVGK